MLPRLQALKALLQTRTLRLPLPHRVSSFHTSQTLSQPRIYDSVRSTDTFHTLLLTHTTSSTPLITYWTTSYCPACRVVKPLLWRAVEGSNEKIGLAEVELDAPGDVGELGLRYSIHKVPTIMVFVRGESVGEWRVEGGDERMRGKALESKKGWGSGGGRGLWESLFG
ncbi:hypothetical protein C7212DRAFT_323693 [Tuber magnatum]|uniref:Thioredoxin domain-containing protein n=1 Tax=Tuber magnatum TaxID=42249 RepID=A0A317SYP5_9PEZI|nr:hypothetical protein C7212DRAFT_323693 [Tuber magnatum]